MARYFMHLRASIDELLDPEGHEFPSLGALEAAVMRCARDLLAADLHEGVLDFRYRIDAEDDGGNVVYSRPCMHAVNILPHEG